MTTTDHTPLAEQIAREHYLTTRAKCACPDALDAGGDMHAWVAHIATVTERAVRERVAAEIEAHGHASFCLAFPPKDEPCPCGLDDAARIARGGTHA